MAVECSSALPVLDVVRCQGHSSVATVWGRVSTGDLGDGSPQQSPEQSTGGALGKPDHTQCAADKCILQAE